MPGTENTNFANSMGQTTISPEIFYWHIPIINYKSCGDQPISSKSKQQSVCSLAVSPVVDIRDVGNESHESLLTPGQRFPMVIHEGRWGRAVSNAVVQTLENVDFRHWYWEWQNRQKLRRWENSLSSFYQASLFSNYLVGCRSNFTLKSKRNLKTEYCQKQSGRHF